MQLGGFVGYFKGEVILRPFLHYTDETSKSFLPFPQHITPQSALYITKDEVCPIVTCKVKLS